MINFYTEEVSFLIEDKEKVTAWITDAISSENYKLESISYIFCNDTYLLDINAKYLKHSELTDIISFDETIGKLISGDIFISIDRITENAKTFKNSLIDELHRVMIHGVLHFCGYKDKSVTDKSAMRKKEDYYLSLRDF